MTTQWTLSFDKLMQSQLSFENFKKVVIRQVVAELSFDNFMKVVIDNGRKVVL